MNITKRNAGIIKYLRSKGYSFKKIALYKFPKATIDGQSLKPIKRICRGITFNRVWWNPPNHLKH